MDITSPFLLKLKGALFAFLGLLSAAVLLAPVFSWQALGMFVISVWAFCRAYYFCFYVLHHYGDPSFRYAGLWDLVKGIMKRRCSGE
ncbi:hypothetical protein [Luteolibacter sp. LG18]|uniref:hypothetical protein n=1 Tax=Luteolibacter sp. LG18 TaxID=2819286 RepID=UPI0030C6D6FD